MKWEILKLSTFVERMREWYMLSTECAMPIVGV